MGDGSDYTAINKVHIFNQRIRDLLNHVEYSLLGEIKKISNRTVYPETTIICEWPIGGVQKPHTDLYSNPDLETNNDPANPAREWTCIVNLNDDYRDGRTYFPQSELNEEETFIEPKVGSGTLFQGIHHLHGVETVRGCSRWTIALWFTSDFNKMMIDQASKDLDRDHVTLRM